MTSWCFICGHAHAFLEVCSCDHGFPEALERQDETDAKAIAEAEAIKKYKQDQQRKRRRRARA